MDTKELIKKYWFVGVVALAMIVFIVLYAVKEPTNNEYKVSTLKNDGKDVIYTLNGENYYYADDLFAELKDAYGSSVASNALYRAVVNKAIADDQQLNSMAYNWSQYIMTNMTEDDINQAMKEAGYNGIDDLTKYCLVSLKQEKLIKEFFLSNEETYVKPLIETENPRKCWHILIKVADVEEITDDNNETTYVLHATPEEQAKIDAVKEALKTKSFEDVAKEFSEDGSATSGGYLGVVTETNKSNYVVPFANATMELEFGQTSDEVITEYGCHFIKVDEATSQDLLDEQTFFQSIQENNQSAIIKAIMQKADELGFVINDEKLKNDLEEAMKDEEETSNDSETEIITEEQEEE